VLLTGRNDVVHDQCRLPWLHSILLNLKEIFSILLHETRRLSWARKLALLPDWGEACSQSQRERWAKEKTARIECNNNVWLGFEGSEDLQLQRTDQGFVQLGVGEEREDIYKVDTSDRKVGEVTEGAVQSYLPLGEFGGAGGIGGGEGELSRGIVR
jgi:hypothetical protein